MRNSIIILALSIVFSMSGEVVFTETAHDFGRINEKDGIVTHEFIYKNIGDDTVSIRSIRSSCGCTTAKHNSAILQPGDSNILAVHYNPSGRPGHFEKIVSVNLSDGSHPRLTITGMVVPTQQTIDKVFPESSGMMRFNKMTALVGDVKQGRRSTASIIGYNNSNDTLHLHFGNSTSKNLTYYAEPSIVAPGETTAISLTFHPDRDAEIGRLDISIPLYDKDKRIVGLGAVGQVVAHEPDKRNFTKSPQLNTLDRLDCTPIKTGATKKIELKISNIGKTDLKISGATTLDKALRIKKFPKLLKPGKEGKIIIELDASLLENPNLLNSSIIIFSNDAAHPTRQVKIVGTTEQ